MLVFGGGVGPGCMFFSRFIRFHTLFPRVDKLDLNLLYQQAATSSLRICLVLLPGQPGHPFLGYLGS